MAIPSLLYPRAQIGHSDSAGWGHGDPWDPCHCPSLLPKTQPCRSQLGGDSVALDPQNAISFSALPSLGPPHQAHQHHSPAPRPPAPRPPTPRPPTPRPPVMESPGEHPQVAMRTDSGAMGAAVREACGGLQVRVGNWGWRHWAWQCWPCHHTWLTWQWDLHEAFLLQCQPWVQRLLTQPHSSPHLPCAAPHRRGAPTSCTTYLGCHQPLGPQPRAHLQERDSEARCPQPTQKGQ